MRIEEELKLDYSDVLFRPKRSTLKSRKDVNLLRTYRFKSVSYTHLRAHETCADLVCRLLLEKKGYKVENLIEFPGH